MPTHHIYYPVKELCIVLHRVDSGGRGSNTFLTLQEFKLFLDENPEIVRLLKTREFEEPFKANRDIDLETRI